MARRLGLLLVAGLIASACSSTPTADAPAQNTVWQTQDAVPDDLPLVDITPSSSEAVPNRGGPWQLTIMHDLASNGVVVPLVAPNGAVDVQIATEPTFGESEWRLVEDLVYRTPSTGVQELFVRYRDHSGDVVGDLVTAAFSLLGPIDPMVGEEFEPELARLTRIAPDVLQVDLLVGDVVYGETGAKYVDGPDLDVDKLTDIGGVELRIDGSLVSIVDSARTTVPTGNVGREAFAVRHTVHLRSSEPLSDGRVELRLPDLGDDPITAIVGPLEYSPAVKVNQLGWATGDGSKVGYVSSWSALREPIAPSELTARVVDDADEVVLRIEGRPFARGSDTELWRGDLSGAPTTSFDLSELTATGRYRLCIDTIGCSPRFDLSATGPWQTAAATVSRALFHQRSGQELGPPHTAIERPRPYHPDDGTVVKGSDQTLFDDYNGRGDGQQFVELIERRNGELIDDAWGGHFDAGDWDRRIQHAWMARRLIDLVDEFPAAAELELNIPESGDDVPDLLDEARWTLDLFRRMQLPDGGIRGGVEAAEHPAAGSTSWTEQLDVFAYAPDSWSSAIYAGVAADMAHVLDRYDPSAATAYLDSAIAAMEWAESDLEARPKADADVDVQRAIAAVSLYRATGDDRWHELFESLTPLTEAPEVEPCILATSCEASWRYARLPRAMTDPVIRTNAEASIVGVADQLLRAGETTAFGWVPEGPNVVLVWGLGPSIPHGVGLMRAYLLTGDERYRNQVVRNAAFALGANPQGMAYITGIGTDNPRHPLMVDQQTTGLPVWPGTPVYGAFTTWRTPNWYTQSFVRGAGATPDPAEWPTLQNFVDLGVFAGQSEFTVQQSHGEAIWTFGSLLGTTAFASD